MNIILKSVQVADYFSPVIAYLVVLLLLVGLAGLLLIGYKFFTWDRLRYSSEYALKGPPSRIMLAPIFGIFLIGTIFVTIPAVWIYKDTFKIKITTTGDWLLVNPYFISFGKIDAMEVRTVRLSWSELWTYYKGGLTDIYESTDFEITTEPGVLYRFSTLSGSTALKDLGYTEESGCAFTWDTENRILFPPHTYNANGPACN